MVCLKVSHGRIKRRFTLREAPTYTAFRAHLISLFGVDTTGTTPESITLSYNDSDGDLITVSSDEELAEMFRCHTGERPLLVTMHTPATRADADRPRDTAQDAQDAHDAAQRAAHAARDNAQRAAEHARASADRATDGAQASVEAALAGLGSFLSAFQAGFAPGAAPPPPPPFGAGFAPGFGRGPGGGRRQRARRMDFSAFAPLMAAFAPLAAAFHQGAGVCHVSDRTCAAFRQLRDAVVEADNRDDILGTAREVFPSVREWAMANLSGDIEQGAIDELCNTVSQRVQPVAGERVAGSVTHLIRAALADEAVLRILRHVPWEATEGLDAEIRGPGSRGGGRGCGMRGEGGERGFEIHRSVECDNCGKAPIIGSRYKATNRPNYDLCGECYNNENVSKEGLEFKECKYVWEAPYPDATVPPSPIGFGDRGPAVAFLQKVLTDLGYMNTSMYRWRVGVYGPKTRNAVEQFQREYGLETVAEIGQYDATTAASLTSVLEAQVPPRTSTGGAASGDASAGAGPSQPAVDAPGPEPSPAQG